MCLALADKSNQNNYIVNSEKNEFGYNADAGNLPLTDLMKKGVLTIEVEIR